MKVMLVNGSPHEKGCTYTAFTELAGTFEKEGIWPDIFRICIREKTVLSEACGGSGFGQKSRHNNRS